MEYLEQNFEHKEWFVNGVKNKHAIQYFVACGDFKLNKYNDIVYTGRGGGRKTDRELAVYFKELMAIKNNIVSRSKSKEAEFLNSLEWSKTYIDNGMIVSMSKSGNAKFCLTSYYFIDYLKNEVPHAYKDYMERVEIYSTELNLGNPLEQKQLQLF